MTSPIVTGVALRDDDHAPVALGRELALFTGAPLALAHVYRRDPPAPLEPPACDVTSHDRALAADRPAA